MSYNPKIIFDSEEHGLPFEDIDASLSWLLKEGEKRGYQVQAIGFFSVDGITRFANNQVTQHTDLNTISYRLQISKGKKVAEASTTLLGQEGLTVLLKEAENSLKNTPEINFYQGLPDLKPGDIDNLSGRSWTIEERADSIIEAVNSAIEIDPNVKTAGVASEEIGFKHIKTTNGIDYIDGSTSNYFKINAITGNPDNRGYGQEESYWRFIRSDITKMATEATNTAKDTEKLITLNADHYEVILAPQAVSDLLIYLQVFSDAVGFHESNSYTSDKLGDQIFDSQFTLKDVPKDPKEAIFVRSFDNEGIPTKNRVFIDQGVLKFIPYNSFYASKYLEDKNLTTGHAMNLNFSYLLSGSIEQGNKTLDQQISEMENGLYVKNFWYNRFTKRKEGGLTGLTRNGLYHVKNGEIQGAVRNLRYTESFVNAFGPDNIISISKERNNYQYTNCPNIHLKSYNFSSIAHTST
ncbi:MAG: TldD/PmbA family protein [Candidatus Heimdallarchaeota archaeon]|nr:TldD/PmbA family protein [Candidatus Heimdallarchaeota archaeon]